MNVATSPEFDSLLPEQKFDRRNFLVTSLAAGFAARRAAGIGADHHHRQPTGSSPAKSRSRSRTARCPPTARCPQAAGRFPTVLVVQEIFGVHEHIKDVCRRFAKVGYFAIAPELYARQGDVSKISNIQEIIDNVV